MWKDYCTPATLAEALAILTQHAGAARVVAGCTDMSYLAHTGELTVACAVDITRIPDLTRIAREGDSIVLGACVTHAQAAASPLIREVAPVLAAACGAVGSPQIRNVGTIGGNIVNAQPAADSVISLLALDATVEVLSPEGTRVQPLSAAFSGPGQSTIDPRRELLTAVRFRALGTDQGSAFARLARRRALALPILCVAVVVTVTAGKFSTASVAMGPVAPTPARAAAAEAWLRGAAISRENLDHAAQLAADEARPRSSALRGSSEFRKRMVRVLVRRALAEACGLASA